ncbi:hypothetical protein [Allokutzneria oryzae]|uniref:Secreted protein n=1 Tax=Allokutzneria oryzae TaxID=1378989 RepID=A0ABV5ZUA7_9PSEU
MFRRIAAVVALVCVGAVLPAGSAAADQRGDCRATASVPTYSGGQIYAKASVTCKNRHANLVVRAWVVRDGSLQGVGTDKTCPNSKTCEVTATKPNMKGDQEWCTIARAFNFGSGYARDEKCEHWDF